MSEFEHQRRPFLPCGSIEAVFSSNVQTQLNETNIHTTQCLKKRCEKTDKKGKKSSMNNIIVKLVNM